MNDRTEDEKLISELQRPHLELLAMWFAAKHPAEFAEAAGAALAFQVLI